MYVLRKVGTSEEGLGQLRARVFHRPGETGTLLRSQDSPYFIRGSTPYDKYCSVLVPPIQGKTKLTEIEARQSPLQVITVITISSNASIVTVFQVCKGIIVEVILFKALQKIHHRLALRS